MSREPEVDDWVTGASPDHAAAEIWDREKCEFLDGEWVEKDVGAASSAVNSVLIGYLSVYVREHKLGHVFESEAGYQIFPAQPKRVRKPDVSFVRAGRFEGGKPPQGNIKIAPDLVVEVSSPKDLLDPGHVKLLEYLDAGVTLVWAVYPPGRSALVLHQDGSARLLREADSLDGEGVIPGFKLPLAKLFEGV